MSHNVAPGQSVRLAKRKGVSRNRGQAVKGLNSIRACRERAVAVTQAAEQGIISASHARALLANYRTIVSLMLDEHELKMRNIRDEAPTDNSPEPEDDLVLGTHIKRKALVKKGMGKDGQRIEERTVSLEVSGPDPGVLTQAEREHDVLADDELAEAMRPVDDDE